MTNQSNNSVATQQENGVELVASRNTVVSETSQYVVSQDAETGKFSRKAKYNEFSSFVAESRADKIWLLNLFENAEDSGMGLKDNVGVKIEVAHILTRPYDKINEDTGEFEYGVLTYLITPQKEVYVTSAKSVYFSITRIMDLFGKPTDADWENIFVTAYKEKMANGDAIKIKMVG